MPETNEPTCQKCGAALSRNDRICPSCKAVVIPSKGKKIHCDKCGYFPIIVPSGGLAECPICKKTHLDM